MSPIDGNSYRRPNRGKKTESFVEFKRLRQEHEACLTHFKSTLVQSETELLIRLKKEHLEQWRKKRSCQLEQEELDDLAKKQVNAEMEKRVAHKDASDAQIIRDWYFQYGMREIIKVKNALLSQLRHASNGEWQRHFRQRIEKRLYEEQVDVKKRLEFELLELLQNERIKKEQEAQWERERPERERKARELQQERERKELENQKAKEAEERRKENERLDRLAAEKRRKDEENERRMREDRWREEMEEERRRRQIGQRGRWV